ncbi:hypothetical protein TCAL_12548 [Tigriopus californicus]|uniref:Uncharacterized protein n=1 Tax=Tigriopus californicus TaxID=6832 RepID=A0A553N754_TIGCA|nr:uncharacterized protein LOC131885737 [Tigriopus californicus]TRY61268.1 hypothetical protein TCAL_12548 [Tigriopus californicus]|eukprot:TCALIF_12548-PA protein Name:"Protein of unknown function" AED:0.00 eAED:0.00 QI:80/1/1/1/1/1/2/613/430
MIRFCPYVLFVLTLCSSAQAAFAPPGPRVLNQISDEKLAEILETLPQVDNDEQGEEDVDFTLEDEEQLIDDLIDLNAEVLLEQAPSELFQSVKKRNHEKSKRFTVDFNGMQVSYPTYVRLSRLQAKVVKLQKMIQMLHRRYTPEQLDGLPQYGRLMELYQSLRPLLPTTAIQDILQPEATPIQGVVEKRSFGSRPTLSNQERMLAIFEHVGDLERLMERIRQSTPAEQLDQDPQWQILIHLHRELNSKLAKYSFYHNMDFSRSDSQVGTDLGQRSKRSTKFNDVYVSVPEYGRLKEMQKTAMKLDVLLRKMVKDIGLNRLQKDTKWNKLVELRQSLQKLLPEDHPEFDVVSAKKRSVVMDFNGVQVSYPQYLHLMSLQRKVQKLDMVMMRISQMKSPEELAGTPQWGRLHRLRQALVGLLPIGGGEQDSN